MSDVGCWRENVFGFRLVFTRKGLSSTKWVASLFILVLYFTHTQPQLNPQLNLNSTSTQPQLNLNSTSTQPQLNLNSTSTQPQLNLNILHTHNLNSTF